MKKILLTPWLFVTFFSFAETNEVPFTLEDRDRLIRLDERLIRLDENIKSLQADIKEFKEDRDRLIRLDENVKSLQNDIKEFKVEIRADIRMLIYIFFSGIFVLIGFVLWDRRTTISPIVKENEALKKAFKKLAEKNKDAKEALKYAAII